MATKAINWGAFYLGQTFQELRDIGSNAYVLYSHGDLERSRVKTLTIKQSYELQIYEATRRSRFFIFRDYTFTIEPEPLNNRVQILPLKENPSSLYKIFFQESFFRLAKGVAILATTVLTSPLWALVLAGALIYQPSSTSKLVQNEWSKGSTQVFLACSQQHIILPSEPADSHITTEDILKIGNALIGYRHVSTEELAQSNALKGIPDGCALNISFCETEGGEGAVFENLDLKIKRGEKCDPLIQQYEKAITAFIANAIGMDFEQKAPTTYGELVASIDRTRFMIIKTECFRSADAYQNGYGGLGRFPKQAIPPERVILLPRLERAELGISETQNVQPITSPNEHRALLHFLASLYRRKLLQYLRQDFNPCGFNFITRFN